MNSSAPKSKTVHEQWLELPENVVGEIINGVLYASPRPAPKHGNAASSLLHEVMGPFHKGNGGPGGWIIQIEPEVHLESNVVVPDIAGWKRERMPKVPDEAFFSVVPDWICEVLSPSTAVLDRVKKMPLYGSQGVKHLWLVDPIAKTLEVFENDHAQWKFLYAFADDAKVRAVPFDAIELDLSALWS